MKEYLHFGHGIGTPSANFLLSIWFDSVPTEKERKTIEARLEHSGHGLIDRKVLDVTGELSITSAHWKDHVLTIVVTSSYSGPYIAWKYGKQSKSDINQYLKDFGLKLSTLKTKQIPLLGFTRHVDGWLSALFKKFPFSFCVTAYGSNPKLTTRHELSVKQSASIWPILIPYFKTYSPAPKYYTGLGTLADPSRILLLLLKYCLEPASLKALTPEANTMLYNLIVSAFGDNYDNDCDLFNLLFKLKKGNKKEVLEQMPEPFRTEYRKNLTSV